MSNKDILAPCILFSVDIWGSKRVLDQIDIVKDSLYEGYDIVKNCTDIALNIRYNHRPTVSYVYSEMDYELFSRLDPEDYQKGHGVDEKALIIRTSRLVISELKTYFRNIRNSLEKILKEIETFNSETLPVVRTIDYGSRIRENIRFCLVQCDFPVKESPRTEPFGYSLDGESDIKAKIFSALELGKENDIAVICFPELSFRRSWVEEIQREYDNMVIVGGLLR